MKCNCGRLLKFCWRICQSLIVLAICLPTFGQTYRVTVQTPTGLGHGSAVYIGSKTFVTARHVLPRGGFGHVFADDGTKQVIVAVKWHETADLASFEVRDATAFRGARIASDVPDGVSVTLCGHTPQRNASCFSGRIVGGWITGTNGQHVQPGDSGGGVFVDTGGKRCLAGVHFGYADSRQTAFVPAVTVCQFLQRQYGVCPQCIPYNPRPQPVLPRPRVKPPTVEPGRANVVVDYDRLADLFFQKYGAKLRGPAGAPGTNGNDGAPGEMPKLDLRALAAVIVQEHGDKLRGEPGQPGEPGTPGQPGERGLIGVPSEEQIAAVVDTWVARNDVRIRQYITDIIQTEQLAETPQRVLIVDGKTNTVLDDETYQPGEPIVLDIQRLLLKSDAN